MITSRPPVTRPAPEDPCLVVLDGPRLGDGIHLRATPSIIGRDPQVDFQLLHPSVSRRHCSVWREDGLSWMRDLGSTNGCVVNGHRVSRALLNEGDHVELGDVVLKFVSGRLEARYHQALSGLAARDTLTGLLNRRRFRETLDALMSGPATDGAIAVGILDIDHFKLVNDRLGHGAGDLVLAAVADCLQAAVQPGEVAGRLGGDEFAVVLLADGARAQARCDALRAAVEVLRGTIPDGGEPITLSVGVAAGGGRGGSELLQAADLALLEAKRAGRNRVALAP